ncbi:ATP-binding protein [Streptomyces sp. NPDC056632]|uniref:ATP-binding protein n=1 Tax=Streptomyces sp. NPDC056632 TaxID=3345884 RepID=UPI0036C1A650
MVRSEGGSTWAGRGREADVLQELVRRVVAGGCGGSVLVEGEPGAGKTALLTGLVAEAQRLGCRVAQGVADEFGRRFPLSAMLDCLDADGDGSVPTRIVAFLYGEKAEAASGREPMAAATEELVRQIDDWCAASPLVLVLDNLQWADRESLAVWQLLHAKVREDRPLLLVGACRPGAGGDRLAPLRQTVAEHGTLLPLAPLTVEETARFVMGVLGAEPTPRLLRHLADAGGNPYLLRELLDLLVRRDAIDTTSGRADLSAADGEDGRRPLSVRSVTERLEFLSPGAIEVLRMATVLGAEFAPGELARLLERDLDDPLRHVDELISGGAFEETGGQLRFRQQVIREALYESIPGSLRSALHLQAAKALESEGAQPCRVAEQVLPVRELPDAWTVSWVVRNVASLVHRAPGVAVELAGRVLQRVPGGGPDAEHLKGVIPTGMSLLRRPGATEQVRELRERSHEPWRKAEFGYLLAVGLLREGQVPEALAEVDTLLGQDVDSTAGELKLLGLRSYLLWRCHRYDESAIVAERVVTRTRAVPSPSGEVHARFTLANLALRRRDHQGCLRHVETGIEVAGQSDETADEQVVMLLLASYTSAILERMDHAAQRLDEARALARHSPSRQISVRIVAGLFKFRIGRWDEALEDLRIDPARALHADPWLPVMMRGISALIEAARDRWREVDEQLAGAAELVDDPNIPGSQIAYVSLAAALVAEREGAPDRALSLLLPTLDPDRVADLDNRCLWLPDMVRLALATEETGHARAATEAAETEAERAPEDGFRRAAAQRCRGLLERDPEPLRAAVAYLERLGYLPALGHTHEDLAVVEAQLGNAEPARIHYRQAVTVYESMGAQWYVARADARLRALGVRRGHRRAGPASRTKSGWDSLTPAEAKVALLVAKGLSNPQIAAELLLSPRTVQTHVSHILGKLGMRSRTDIAREAAGRTRDGGPLPGRAPLRGGEASKPEL